MKRQIPFLCMLLSIVFQVRADQQEPLKWLDQISLPDGFHISVFADDVENARSLATDANGVIYVGTRDAGNVYALRDTDKDGVADQRYVIAENLNMPNGVTMLNGALYVATVEHLLRWKNPNLHIDDMPEPEILSSDFPHDTHHGWRYLKAGPDNQLYMTIGAPCNVCKKPKPIYATIVRINADGDEQTIIAKGVRNSVGMDWHPKTNELYFNENGRDHLGDDIPPDELNHLSESGMHFGFPYCHGRDIADKKYGKKKSCHELQPPVWSYPAHIAPLGLHFYRGSAFPNQYQGQLFVAQHGSWNRSTPHGYRIALVEFQNGKPVSESVFAEGWLQADETILGRPVDILELNDGSLLVSDDKRGVIYRITYEAKTSG